MCFIFKKHKSVIPQISFNDIVPLLGGHDNIISYLRSGSRISIECNDVSLINATKLKENGIDNVIVMSHKVILISKFSDEIFRSLSDEN